MDKESRAVFDRMFAPQSLAIVGISKSEAGIGRFFLANLERAGYRGRIFLVNRDAGEIMGRPVYPDIAALPEAVDLAILCVPARFVLSLLEECRGKGIRNVHLFTSGFKELGTPEGRELENKVREEALRGRLNLMGPNCMGSYVPASGLMLFGQIPGTPGGLAFLSQSGSLTQRMTEHAHFLGFGLSKAVSFGNATVLDSTEYLEYLEEDNDTKAVGFYLESVKDGRRFLEVAERVNRRKPLVVWKGGKTSIGARAAASHTGTLAGEDRVWEHALRQIGVARADSLEEVAATALAFLRLPPPRGRRLFILGGGGGNSVFYADICLELGLEIPPLTGNTRERISALVPAVGSFALNPVDAWQSFHDPDLLARMLDLVFDDPAYDMIILDRLIHRRVYATPENPKNIPLSLDYLKRNRGRKPLVAVVDGFGDDLILASEAIQLRRLFNEAGIPAYPSLPLAARALAHLVHYYEKHSPTTR
jgi:acyl-CoA synthetase (NDP forming)